MDKDRTSRTPMALLPYQQRWLADEAPVKVIEKSRRIGLSWAEAADVALLAASRAGMDVWYIGYNKDMAGEFIEDCGDWLRHYGKAAGQVEEFVFNDENKDIMAFRIRCASGHKITALSSRPSNLRGKQGKVVIDEAAFHDDLGQLIKAAMALLMWGGRVVIISTHDGEKNEFNELVNEARSRRKPYSLHRVTLDDALAEGFYERICLRLGKSWSAAGQQTWRQSIIDMYGSGADEELFCIPSQGSGLAILRILIEQAMTAERPVVRLALDDKFTARSVEYREEWAGAWITENLEPLLAGLDPELEHYFGQDFARRGDFSVITPLAVCRNLVRRVDFVIELHNVPVRQQEQILWHTIDHLPRFRAGALDATGSGGTLAEYTADKYGHERIFQVMLNDAWYRDNMINFQAAFEDGLWDLPRDVDIMNDIQALKKIDGIIKLPKTKTADSKNKKFKRHGDAAIALALGWFASSQDVGDTTILTAMPRETDAMLRGF